MNINRPAFCVLIFIAVSFCLIGCPGKSERNKVLVRIGWQIPLATQGQVVQVLKRRDSLPQRGLEGRFAPFSYGGPQAEAALAGELDVIFVGDQPVINLIARGGKWKIVSRLFYTRTAIMAPIGSPIQKMEDLRGKTLASPFGTVAHREATLKEASVGLDPDKDVKNINVDILEISNLVQAGGTERWGNIDAVGVWEPTTSLFEQKNLARVVDSTRTLGVIAMSEEFIAKNPAAAAAFLAAVLESWAYFAANTDQVNKWYIDDAKLSYSPEVLASAAKVEPNYSAKSIDDIDLRLSEDHIATLEKGAQWSFDRGFAKTKANMKSAVDQTLLDQAIRSLKAQQK
jgi:ABC-type nitrate/sulfonate/bicarbonate transport system substrate-binding protein